MHLKAEHQLIDLAALKNWKQLVVEHGGRINTDYVKLHQILGTNEISAFRASRNDYFVTRQSLDEDDGPSVDHHVKDKLNYFIDSQATTRLTPVEQEGLAIALGSSLELRTFELR